MFFSLFFKPFWGKEEGECVTDGQAENVLVWSVVLAFCWRDYGHSSGFDMYWYYTLRTSCKNWQKCHSTNHCIRFERRFSISGVWQIYSTGRTQCETIEIFYNMLLNICDQINVLVDLRDTLNDQKGSNFTFVLHDNFSMNQTSSCTKLLSIKHDKCTLHFVRTEKL